MTTKELQDALVGCDPDKEVITHAYITETELQRLLTTCSECGCGPHHKVTLQMQSVRDVDHQANTGTCFLYLD